MLPTAGMLGGMRPLAPPSSMPSPAFLTSLGHIPLPHLVTTSVAGGATPFLVESLLRERGYQLARPVATKPLGIGNDEEVPRNDMYKEELRYDLRDYYKDEAARHYLGLLTRPAGPDRLTPPPASASPDNCCSDPSSTTPGGERSLPPSPQPPSKPHLKFSVTAILGQDRENPQDTSQDQGQYINNLSAHINKCN